MVVKSFITYVKGAVLFIFSQLTNLPNKVECYITIGRKGLPLANTPAYWAHS